MKPAAIGGKMSRLSLSCTRTQIGRLSFVSSFQHLRTTTRKYSTAFSIGLNRIDAPHSDSCKTKRYSSTWNSQKPSDLDNMTPIDREKALFLIKRRMGAAHSKGTDRKILLLEFQITMARLYLFWQSSVSVLISAATAECSVVCSLFSGGRSLSSANCTKKWWCSMLAEDVPA